MAARFDVGVTIDEIRKNLLRHGIFDTNFLTQISTSIQQERKKMKKLICILLVGFAAVLTFAISACDHDQCSDNTCITCCGVDKTYDTAIRNRFQTGFNNWNKGYLAWLDWCNELYDANAYYNVYGHRLTLDEYKRMMGAMFEQYEIMLGGLGEDAGAIENVLVDSIKGVGSIQYAVSFKKKTESEWVTLNTMEFVQFRPDDEFGARVVEGWAISDTQINPDPEVIGFWMNPANDWDTLLQRVATWE